MESKKLVSSITFTCIRITIYVVLLIGILMLGNSAYKFGSAIFSHSAMAEEPGEDVTVTIRQDMSVYKIGQLLERRGLIGDARTFVVQEFLSAYHGELVPGSYVLNTSYNVEEMLAIMADQVEEESEGS